MPREDAARLVGRDEELARLLAAVERAAAGRPSAVLLSGDAGVGKTRLIDELAAGATARGVRVLLGHCVDLGEVGLPYLPFADLLRPLTDDVRGLLAGGAAAEGEVPQLASLPGRAGPRPSEDARLAVFESVAALFDDAAAETPLLVVLEDLHWADRSSRDLLRYLLAHLVDERIAVVASYRSDDLHRRHPLRPLLAELVRLPAVERLDLAPLPDARVGELVRELAAGSGGVPQHVVDDVVTRAEGNAFYAEELLAAGLQGETLPMALTDVLLARVERLGEAAQRVLRVAAVAGRRVRHELVAAVGGLPADALETALAEAVHSHVLVVDPDGRYRFRHALLREAVLADLLPGERVRLHAAVAAFLATAPGAGTAAELAHHARESHDLPRALSASLAAADEACRVGAPAEQLMHLEAVLELWDAVRDAGERAGRDRAALLVDAAGVARAAGQHTRVAGLLRSALEELGPDGDPERRARAHTALSEALVRLDDLSGALRESESALALLPADPPSPARTLAAASHVRSLFGVGRDPEAEALAEDTMAAADALGLGAAWAETAVTLSRVRGERDPGPALEVMVEARERVRRSGDVETELRVLYNLAALSYERADLPATLRWAGEAVRRAGEEGTPWSFYSVESRHIDVVARFTGGDWDTSLAHASAESRVPDAAAHVRAAALHVLVGRGDPAAAELVRWARGLVGRRDTDVLLLLTTATAEIELAGWAADAAAAAATARTAAARLQELWGPDSLAALRLAATGLGPVGDAVAAARLVGDAAGAERWAAEGAEVADVGRAAHERWTAMARTSGPEAQAWRARLEAEVSRLAGPGDVALWRAAVEAFGYGAVYEQARCRWRLAGALLAADDRPAAVAELRAAHEVAVRLGAVPLRTAVEALARRGRLDLDLPGAPRTVDPSAVLTPREQEVLALLAQGRTNRQIGAALFISEKTASVHVSNILAKLEAGGRTEAVAIAAAKGLLPVPTTSS